MKWSFFGKKRLEFCAGKSSTSSPATPNSSVAASPFRSLACTAAPPSPDPTDYVGTKLYQSSQPLGAFDDACSAEFLFESSPGRPQHLSPSADDVEAAEAEEDASPLTPCSVRSCPEPEQVLGFCPNCHSVVLPLTKKRPHIRTNPWLWTKRARVGGDGRRGAANGRQGTATSITDSGIFDPSPVTSAQESAQTPGTDTPVGRTPSVAWRTISDSSSSDDDTLAERREQRRRYRKRRRRRRQKQQQAREKERQQQQSPENNENQPQPDAAIREEQSPLLLFPRARSRYELTQQQQQPLQQPVQKPLQQPGTCRTAFRPILVAPTANQSTEATASPVFRLPQSDNSDLWEVRGEQKPKTFVPVARRLSPSPPPPPTPPCLRRPSPSPRVEDEDAMADAEVCEYSRRHVSHIRSSLRERIEQLKRDRVLLEERLQVTRGSTTLSARQEECWAREVRDYRKQLLLRMLTSAKGQVNRHLDRLQDSYDALLLEKLNTALESAQQRRGEELV